MGENKMEKKKKKIPAVVIVIFLIIVFNMIGFLGTIFLSLKSMLFHSGSSQTRYSDVQMVSASCEVVPEYKGQKASEGNQIYRFDVVVDNLGTQKEHLEYTMVHVAFGDGTASTIYEDEEKNGQDTRILPPGRRGVVSVYAEVSNDSTWVELRTYLTPDGEERIMNYTLPASNTAGINKGANS